MLLEISALIFSLSIFILVISHIVKSICKYLDPSKWEVIETGMGTITHTSCDSHDFVEHTSSRRVPITIQKNKVNGNLRAFFHTAYSSHDMNPYFAKSILEKKE
jgi:hypothetical protein